MISLKTIITVDAHTMGEPTRVVIGGFPQVRGFNMAEKKIYMQKNLDYLRTALMHEPRGHNDMFGAVILPPTSQEADLGLVFMDSGGYLNMCGHGTIGAVTVAIETGIIEKKEPVTDILLDTPAGEVRVKAEVTENRVKKVSFVNVPSYVVQTNVPMSIPAVGDIEIDIAFGGSFFAIANAKDLGIKIAPDAAKDLIRMGLLIRQLINERVQVKHPLNKYINKIDLVEIYGPSQNPAANSQNAVIFGGGQLDRSPCGTGTCAKMAVLYQKGHLKINQTFVHESIIGTLFEGRVLEETRVGMYPAVVPEIKGQAYITGYQHFVIDPEDPVKFGFHIGNN